MAKAPSFQFYPDDFIGGTVDLSAVDVGCYIRLLCAQWGRGEIPSDPEKLARICGATPSADVLAKFPGGKNARMERVRNERAAFLEKCSRAGHASVQRRFNAGSTSVEPTFQGGFNSPSPSPSPSPSVDSNVQSQKQKAAEPPPLPFASEAFTEAWSDWLAYRRERKLTTLKPISLKAQFRQLVEWGEMGAIASIRDAIRNNYQGLFPPKQYPHNTQPRQSIYSGPNAPF